MARASLPIKLTAAQGAILQGLARGREVVYSMVERARIILNLSEGKSNKETSEDFGLCEETVGRWRKRWLNGCEKLQPIEDKVKKLEEEIVTLLSDQPRSGCPTEFSAEQVCMIVALACEKPPEPITHWTRGDLVRETVKRGIATKISETTIGRILSGMDLKPHKSRYWLNHTVTDEAAFRAEVRAICKVYHQAEELNEQGVRVLSLDEKTGIQALERAEETRPMEPGKPEAVEFEYIRHGTQTLIANFDVVTGEVVSPSVQETRTEADLVEHVKATIQSESIESCIFIADQLNTHKSEGLVRLIAEQLDIKDDLGEKGKSGTLKDMDSRAKFLSDETHRIRFLYTPKHCSWLNQVEIWFGILSRRVLTRGNFKSKEDLRERILKFIDFFNATLAKPFRWTYIGKPLMT